MKSLSILRSNRTAGCSCTQIAELKEEGYYVIAAFHIGNMCSKELLPYDIDIMHRCFIDDTGMPVPESREGKGQNVLDHIKWLNEVEGLKADFSWSEDGKEVVFFKRKAD